MEIKGTPSEFRASATIPSRFLGLVVAIVALTDAAVLLDIPVLRQITTSVTFFFIPGFLTAEIMRIKSESIVKKLIIYFGLSLAFLLLGGLSANYALPEIGYSAPLATTPLTITLSIIIYAMCIVARVRNGGVANPFSGHLQRTSRRDLLSFWILAPIAFPVMGILGTRLMVTNNSNHLLLAMYILMAAYAAIMLWKRNKIPQAAIPLSIWMIALSVILSHSMSSNYVVGGDIYTEFESFLYVWDAGIWSRIDVPESIHSLYFSLGVSFLPTVIKSVSGISHLAVFRIACPLFMSIIPLTVYFILRRYFQPRQLFIVAIFTIAQIPFLILLSSHIRVGVSTVFIMLAFMMMFDEELPTWQRIGPFMMLEACAVMTYYAAPIIFLFFMALLWLVPQALGKRLRLYRVVSITAILLLAGLIFLWWGQMTDTGLDLYTQYAVNTIENLSNLFVMEMRSNVVQTMLQPEASTASLVTTIINNAGFLLLGIGVIGALFIARFRDRLPKGYNIVLGAAILPLIATIVLPYMSIGYGADRLFVQVLPLLAPAFVLGYQVMLKPLAEKRRLQLMSAFLALLIVSNSYLLHFVLGGHGTEVFDKNSPRYALLYTKDNEIAASNWADDYNLAGRNIYINRITQMNTSIFLFNEQGRQRPFEVLPLEATVLTSDTKALLFFRRPEPRGIAIYTPKVQVPVEHWIKDYEPTIKYRDLIYTSGETNIYK